jgi:hypothetical protein
VTPEILSEKLLQTAKTQRFGHFYLFQGRGRDREAQIQWAKTFVRRYWQEIEQRSGLPQDLLNDSDLFWLTPWDAEEEKLKNEYVVDDIKPLMSFLGFRGIKARRRFVVIEEAQRLSETVANKMLKILEEPEGELSFLLLNPTGAKLLPTIESRAVSLALSWPQHNVDISFFQTLESKFQAANYSVHDFIDDVKKHGPLPQFVLELLQFAQKQDASGSEKQELLTLVQRLQEAQEFNQQATPQLMGFYLILQRQFRSGR